MNLRVADINDLPDLVRMAVASQKASPFAVLETDPEKIAETVAGIVSGDPTKCIAILSLADEMPVGMVLAISHETLFSRERQVTEISIYVSPDHRKGRRAIELLKAYEYWALNIAKCKVIMIAEMEGLDLSKLYTRYGYQPAERAWFKKVM